MASAVAVQDEGFGALKVPDPVWHGIWQSMVDEGEDNILGITIEQLRSHIEGEVWQLRPEQLDKLKQLIRKHWEGGEHGQKA